MSTAIFTFDTLAAAKRLRETGFSESQAEAVVMEIKTAREMDLEQLATKEDLNALEHSLHGDMRELELRMTIKLGGMIIALGTVLIAVKYFG